MSFFEIELDNSFPSVQFPWIPLLCLPISDVFQFPYMSPNSCICFPIPVYVLQFPYMSPSSRIYLPIPLHVSQFRYNVFEFPYVSHFPYMSSNFGWTEMNSVEESYFL